MIESPHPLTREIKRQGLTPADFANEVGISVQHLNNLVNLRRKPSLEVFEKMRAKVKNLKPSDFRDSRE